MVIEALKRVAEAYLASIRKEKETYDQLAKAQSEMVHALTAHRIARDVAILRLRDLNNAMNAEQRERTLEKES